MSLITANHVQGQVHLLVGTGDSQNKNCSLTLKRLKKLIGLGVHPIVVNPSNPQHLKFIQQELVQQHDSYTIVDQPFKLSHLTTLGRPTTMKIVDRCFVNLSFEDSLQTSQIFNHCTQLRIPINCYNQPEFTNFNPIPTYTDPLGSGLQISVTTNGKGYLLGERIKREIISNLPRNISQIVTNMGHVRDLVIQEQDEKLLMQANLTNQLKEDQYLKQIGYGLDNDPFESHNFNKLVREFDMSWKEQNLRRTRWLSQIMEYYPLHRLADITFSDLENDNIKINTDSNISPTQQQNESSGKVDPPTSNTNDQSYTSTQLTNTPINALSQKGTISLVGSGPGSISMLTLGALNEIKTADIVLADKLVPETVTNLIPESTELFIAKKFPGNAENAQTELLNLALQHLRQGDKVVRLKQGDPYIFGRGGEEYIFFKENGFEPIVLPGVSSALASTVTARIPATQRDITDQVLICTGTGRKGALPEVPNFVKTRTTVFLMALHRIDILVDTLIDNDWDINLPVAIVERASCPDQRVTRTLLKYLPQVVQEIGSRPPGLLITGFSVNKLITNESLIKFDDNHKFHIDEGFNDISIDPSLLQTQKQ